jgi:hypothetical protein
MKIVIDLNRVSVDEIDSLINIKADTTRDLIKNMLWRFIANEDGTPLPEDEARAYVGTMGTVDAMRAMAQVSKLSKELMSEAFPPAQSAI